MKKTLVGTQQPYESTSQGTAVLLWGKRYESRAEFDTVMANTETGSRKVNSIRELCFY
jgi:hypothetical protein